MSSSERSIPHLRDIFGLNSSNGYTMHNSNQLHSSNNINHYNYQNGNGNVVSYVANTTTTATSDINDHTNNALNNNNNNNIINSNKKNSKKKRDNSKTLTSGDVKTLERHLSMKKTIRKKIMRDLQQAFVEDPNEFRIENINQEQLKAEIRVEALRFGGTTNAYGDHQKPSRKSDNFLDMLRGEKNIPLQQQQPQQPIPPSQQQQQQQQISNSTNNYNDYTNGSNREYDYDSQPTQTNEKQSFWRRFTMKNKTKR